MNLYGIEEVRQVVGMSLDICLAEKAPLLGAINYYYSEVSARMAARTANSTAAVSYTHLDVYKRQGRDAGALAFSRALASSGAGGAGACLSLIHI